MDPNAKDSNRWLALTFAVALVDTAGRPVYQQIARKVLQLGELGLSDRVIGKHLGVSDETVGIGWLIGRSP